MRIYYFYFLICWGFLFETCAEEGKVLSYVGFQFSNSFNYKVLADEKCLKLEEKEGVKILKKISDFLLDKAATEGSEELKEIVFSFSQYCFQIAKIELQNKNGQNEIYYQVNAYRFGPEFKYKKPQHSWIVVNGGGANYFNVTIENKTNDILLEINSPF